MNSTYTVPPGKRLMMTITTHAFFLLNLVALTASCSAFPPQDVSGQQQLQGLEWRCVGPFVGCRGTSVEAHPTKKNVFFHGHSSGGVWKTEDSGQYWEPITDGQIGVGSIGALAIPPSEPETIYMGTGEPQLRDCVSWGDGAYKSTDGGETWTHIGLKGTGNISRIRVHPSDANLVYVSAIGNPFGPSEERGIYRSKDGGKTWKRIFFKHNRTGVIDLVMDQQNPSVLYASTMEFRRSTWKMDAGGPNSGIFKSTDGGDTWNDLSRNAGLPKGDWGRVGLAHSIKMPQRITALIDAKEGNGLYQSEDGGETWKFLSNHAGITQRPFYYHHLHASPHNGDELWVLSNKLWQSYNGGKTWGQRSGTKDDFHDMVFDKEDPERMVMTHDGGAMVTRNGGKTWSNLYNQPTQQLYRVTADNQFPYNLYGDGQDLIGWKVPSASIWGGISQSEVTLIGSGESGGCIPHPSDPNIVYHVAQSTFAYGGGPIQRVNLKTGQWEHINVWPTTAFGQGQKHAKYRFNWHFPILLDPFDPETLYTAAECVFRSRDRGNSWEKISGDLTTDDETKQELSGSPSSPESSGQEAYCTIHRMAASPVKQGVLWTGSDDGLVYISQDSGKTWQDVSPSGLPANSNIYEVEASPHDAGTCYIAITRYRTADDRAPYLYKTADFGKSWTKLSDSFPQEEITRTIREDTVRKGLLFVGTETGVFFSLDDGASWNRLNLNLPRVAVNDITIKDEDLCIATHGRSFQILDDISPLRQMSAATSAKPGHLFKPRTHTRLGTNWWSIYGGGVGDGQKNYFVQNGRMGHTFIELGVKNGERRRNYLDAGGARPNGALIYYNLTGDAKEVSLSILTMDDQLIKSYEGDALGMDLGLNRMSWDMKYPDVVRVPGKPAAGVAPQVAPGSYKAKLTVNGKSEVQSFEVRINPNETWTQEDADARFDLWWRLRLIFKNAHETINTAIALAEKNPKLKEPTDEMIGLLMPMGSTLSEIANEPPKLLSRLQSVNWMLVHSEGRPTQSAYQVVDQYDKEIEKVLADYRANVDKVK